MAKSQQPVVMDKLSSSDMVCTSCFSKFDTESSLHVLIVDFQKKTIFLWTKPITNSCTRFWCKFV